MCRIVGGLSWELGIGISSQVCQCRLVGMKGNMQVLAIRLVGPVLAESMYMLVSSKVSSWWVSRFPDKASIMAVAGVAL